MRSSTMTLGLFATLAIPALAAPIYDVQGKREQDLEARKISFGSALKSIGGGVATGGLFAALSGLLGGGSEPAPARRDLTSDEAALIALMMAAQTQNPAAPKPAVQAREVDMTQDEAAVLELLEAMAEKQHSVDGLQARKLPAGLLKGIAGTVAGLGASLGAGAAIDGVVGLFSRENFDDMTSDEAAILEMLEAAAEQQEAHGIQARALPAGLLKGVAGTVAGLGASLGAGALIDRIFSRDLEVREPLLPALALAAAPIVIDQAPSIISKLKGLFSRSEIDDVREAISNLSDEEMEELKAMVEGGDLKANAAVVPMKVINDLD